MSGDSDQSRVDGPSANERRRRWARLNRLVDLATTPGDSLRRRVIHAGTWSFSLRLTQRILTFARTVVLARILAPSDFGLWGIAVLAMSLVDSLTQSGFRKALIQREGDVEGHLDTTWTVEIVRNTAIAILLVVSAPMADRIFDTNGATSLVLVVAVAVWINGFVNIAVVHFERDLEFHRRFMLELGPAIADVAVGIGVALATRSALAFGIGMLAASVTRVIVSYLIVSYRPHLR